MCRTLMCHHPFFVFFGQKDNDDDMMLIMMILKQMLLILALADKIGEVKSGSYASQDNAGSNGDEDES